MSKATASADLTRFFKAETPWLQTRVWDWALVFCAGCACAWFASQLLWALLLSEPTPSPATEQSVQPSVVVAAIPAAPSLAGFHLFGQAGVLATPGAVDAPETQLKLTLVGVAAGRDARGGVAIIADENGQQKSYEADDVVGGATVDQIYSDRVVLRYQGRLETLFLPKISKAQESVSRNANVNVGDRPGSYTAPMVALPNPSNDFVSPTAGVTIAGFDAMREQALANPTTLIGMVQPVMDANGNLSGIKLNGGANQALLTQAGILPTDLVVAVNGQRIDSFERGTQIANQLANAEQVSVTVRRDGREVTLPSVRLK